MTATTTPTTPTSLKRAKEVILQRIEEEDNVTFDELEYLLHRNKLYEETYTEDKNQILQYDIWANDENLILWVTTNRLLAQAWAELVDEDRFDVYYTSFKTYGAYSSAKTGGFPANAQLATKEVVQNAGRPGYPVLKKRYFQPIEMRRRNSKKD
jgi:hypothetical protein